MLRSGQALSIGSCPQPPCFLVTLDDVEMGPKPKVTLGISGVWEGIYMPQAGFSFDLPIVRGCGFKFITADHDLIFEVLDDRLSSPRAVMGSFPGSGPKGGATVKELGC
jgi:hypothetical protein